jgi:hypothetical protein
MEFRTLNRSIDEAIADAVTAFGAEPRVRSWIWPPTCTAGWASSPALVSTLKQLRDLTEKSLPEVRLSAGITTTPPRI